MKKRLIIICLLTVLVSVVTIILVTNNQVNSKKSNKELKYGTYSTNDESAILELFEGGKFVFNIIKNTNFTSTGDYTINDGKLILSDKTVGEYKFMIIDKDTITYEKSNENTDKVIKTGIQYNLTEIKEKSEIIEWHYDLTGDDISEKILINVDSIKDGVTNTVEVYSGKTDTLIWNKQLSLVHADRHSISLYVREGKNYILTWDPAMWQGSSVFEYRIFSLTESGEEIELESKQIVFDEYYCDEEDIRKVIELSYEVNGKFTDSFLLASTVNEICYSTVDDMEKEHFSPQSLVGDMVTNLYINKYLS